VSLDEWRTLTIFDLDEENVTASPATRSSQPLPHRLCLATGDSVDTCVGRPKADADSGGIRTWVPADSGRRFRLIRDAGSG
jgi:hypothetical protein